MFLRPEIFFLGMYLDIVINEEVVPLSPEAVHIVREERGRDALQGLVRRFEVGFLVYPDFSSSCF